MGEAPNTLVVSLTGRYSSPKLRQEPSEVCEYNSSIILQHFIEWMHSSTGSIAMIKFPISPELRRQDLKDAKCVFQPFNPILGDTEPLRCEDRKNIRLVQFRCRMG